MSRALILYQGPPNHYYNFTKPVDTIAERESGPRKSILRIASAENSEIDLESDYTVENTGRRSVAAVLARQRLGRRIPLGSVENKTSVDGGEVPDERCRGCGDTGLSEKNEVPRKNEGSSNFTEVERCRKDAQLDEQRNPGTCATKPAGAGTGSPGGVGKEMIKRVAFDLPEGYTEKPKMKRRVLIMPGIPDKDGSEVGHECCPETQGENLDG